MPGFKAPVKLIVANLIPAIRQVCPFADGPYFSFVSLDCDVSNKNPIIEENNPPGLVIANITTAPDVTVTIDPSSLDHDWFEINGTQLILKNSVDYEVTV